MALQPNTPMNFGAWSGKSYSGGQPNPQPKDFVFLYENVFAKGFLDLAAKRHDAVYEYASRVYGENSSQPSQAMQNYVQFIADMDLMKNALAYQPAPGDFIGAYYRMMIVQAFYWVASTTWAPKTYGLTSQMDYFWDEFLAPLAGASTPKPSPSLNNLSAMSLIWKEKGLERLATSDVGARSGLTIVRSLH